MSGFIKDKIFMLDLHFVLAILASEDAERWHDYSSIATKCAAAVSRGLAISPASMDAKLESAFFADKADMKFVKNKYKKTFEAVVAKAENLNFTRMEWVLTDAWETFCFDVLPLCVNLKDLNLTLNSKLAVDIVELVAKLPPTLNELDLTGTGCYGEGAKAEWGRLPALEEANLSGTNVTWDAAIEELVAVLPSTLKKLWLHKTECFGNGARADWSRLSALEEVDLRNTKVTGDIVELVSKLPVTIKKLDLHYTGCSGDSAKADWSRLPALEVVGLRDTKVNGNIVELVERLPPSIKELGLEKIKFTGDGGKADWARLPALENVALRDTRTTGDIVELVGKLPPTLKGLRLEKTGCFGDSGKAEWARLPALGIVNLRGTKVTGSDAEVKAAGCKACIIYTPTP